MIGVDSRVLGDRVVRQRSATGLPGAHGQARAVPRARTGGGPLVGLPHLGLGERDRGLRAPRRRRRRGHRGPVRAAGAGAGPVGAGCGAGAGAAPGSCSAGGSGWRRLLAGSGVSRRAGGVGLVGLGGCSGAGLGGGLAVAPPRRRADDGLSSSRPGACERGRPRCPGPGPARDQLALVGRDRRGGGWGGVGGGGGRACGLRGLGGEVLAALLRLGRPVAEGLGQGVGGREAVGSRRPARCSRPRS